MKRWYAKGSTKATIGLTILAVVMMFGVFASKPTSRGLDKQLDSASSTESTTKNATPIKEKATITVTRTEIVTTEEPVPYSTIQTYDGTLTKDSTVVRVEGQNGKKVVKTEVKTRDGVEISRALISEEVTVPPVTKVVAIGTKISSSIKRDPRTDCNPNYKPCIPNVRRDLDCDDIEIQVEIIGEDVHNLDEDDQDGIGCERFGSQNVTSLRL